MARYHRHLHIFLVLMLFSIMLTPSLSAVASLPKVRLEEILIALLFFYLVLRSLGNQRIEFAWGLRQTMLLALPLFLFISIGAGLLLGYEASLADLNQLIRIIKYLIIYSLTVSVILLSAEPERTKVSVMHWTLLFACLLALVTIQQYFDLLGLNARYVPLYADERFVERLVEVHRGRPVGMVGNPNELGFLLGASTIVAVFRLLSHFSLFHLAALGLTLTGLLMSGSRSALVACVAGSLVVALIMAFSRMPAKTRFLQRGAAMAGAVVLLAVAASSTDVYGDLMDRFETLGAIEDDASWQARLAKWQENIRLFQASPMIGVGPLRRADLEYGLTPDNEWWLLLRTYGIVGTLYLLAIFIVPHLMHRWDRAAALAFGLYAASALYMIAAVVFHSLALMPLVLILVALSDTGAKRKVLR